MTGDDWRQPPSRMESAYRKTTTTSFSSGYNGASVRFLGYVIDIWCDRGRSVLKLALKNTNAVEVDSSPAAVTAYAQS